MSDLSAGAGAYERKLLNWSAELASGGVEALLPSLAAGSQRADVERYVANAVGERIRMLAEETGLLAQAFANLPALIEQYVRDVPRETFSLHRRELTCFLSFLRRMQDLSSQQADFVAYQEAECACLALATERPREYRDFQARWRSQYRDKTCSELDGHSRLAFNPIHTWTRLSGIAVGATSEVAQPVLFFAHQGEVTMFWHADPAMHVLRTLALLAPRTLEACSRAAGITLDEMLALARPLCEVGLAVVAGTSACADDLASRRFSSR